MIDRRIVREHPEVIREALARRRYEFDLDRLIEVEARRRELLAVEQLRAEKNALSDEIGNAYSSGEKERAEQLKEQVAELSARIEGMTQELEQVEAEFEALMLELPNIPLDEVPDGDDEDDNVILFERGELRRFDFEPLPHWEIGERLGILDFEGAARMAGARFRSTSI